MGGVVQASVGKWVQGQAPRVGCRYPKNVIRGPRGGRKVLVQSRGPVNSVGNYERSKLVVCTAGTVRNQPGRSGSSACAGVNRHNSGKV